jgi:hypothetical protein
MSNQILVQCPKELNFLRPRVFNNLSRMGNIADGGYALTTSALSESSHFLSLGLGENWSFENVVRNVNPKAPIDIYDHTVSLAFFTNKALKGIVKFLLLQDSFSNLKSRFTRLKQYFKFWKRSNLNRHHQVEITRKVFKEVLSEYPGNSRIGLKVDIEGSEWEILESIGQEKKKFEFILLEIHHFDQHEAELEKFLNDVQDCFTLSHLHANNFEPLGSNGFPKVFELTLLKKSEMVSSPEYRQELPVDGLDAPNAKNRPDFHIRFA